MAEARNQYNNFIPAKIAVSTKKAGMRRTRTILNIIRGNLQTTCCIAELRRRSERRQMKITPGSPRSKAKWSSYAARWDRDPDVLLTLRVRHTKQIVDIRFYSVAAKDRDQAETPLAWQRLLGRAEKVTLTRGAAQNLNLQAGDPAR